MRGHLHAFGRVQDSDHARQQLDAGFPKRSCRKTFAVAALPLTESCALGHANTCRGNCHLTMAHGRLVVVMPASSADARETRRRFAAMADYLRQ